MPGAVVRRAGRAVQRAVAEPVAAVGGRAAEAVPRARGRRLRARRPLRGRAVHAVGLREAGQLHRRGWLHPD